MKLSATLRQLELFSEMEDVNVLMASLSGKNGVVFVVVVLGFLGGVANEKL